VTIYFSSRAADIIEELYVPSSYSRIVARELGLQERELPLLLRGTGLPVGILQPGDATHITAVQQMRLLENAQHMAGAAEFGLHLGRRLQPASHGPMGYLVLSSPDVIRALEAFADYLPLRLPFSRVHIALEPDILSCQLELKIEAKPDVQRMLQECFALMIQSVVEAVLGRNLTEASVGLAHPEPAYHQMYREYFHAPVHFCQHTSTVRMPASLARVANASGHSDSYAVAQELCKGLLAQIPATEMSTTDRVRRLLLSSPTGTLTATDIAQAMYVTKRTLQRRLEQEGTNYRAITEQMNSELAARHLRDTSMTIEALSALLGYCDTAAFRKAFHRWYGQSPRDYRSCISNTN